MSKPIGRILILSSKKLGRAYETLKDESKRRDYDRIYPSIKRNHNSGPSQTPRPSRSSSEPLSEAAEICALQKSKKDREARWQAKKSTFDSTIFEVQRKIRQIEQEIKNLDSIAAAEAVVEAKKNSWTTWFLSPLNKKLEESAEEKERKDRERQERRIRKDMKERRLETRNAELKKEERLFKQAKEEIDAADRVDDRKLQAIEEKKRAREEAVRQKMERERQARMLKEQRERQERYEREQAERSNRERIEKKRLEEIRKQEQEMRENLNREAAEIRRKQQAEERAAQQKRHEEQLRTLRDLHAHKKACIHDRWWQKLEGRRPCDECSEVWTYLLQCPSCQMKACPRCQADLRPRRRTTRTAPSPDYF